MRTGLHKLLSVVLICVASFAAPATNPLGTVATAAEVESDRNPIGAPVHYEDQAIVISTKDGVALVRFTDAIPLGRKYVYRFLPAGDGAKEVSGEGKVLETERKPGGPATLSGGQTMIIAGKVAIEWSLGGEKSGWIYFRPELERVHLVDADGSEKLKLNRFAK